MADLQKHAEQAHDIATPKTVAMAPVVAGALKKGDIPAVKPMGMAPGCLARWRPSGVARHRDLTRCCGQ